MLVIKNVTKRFGNTLALDDVTLTINEGEFVFLTGPSGAGKTTLLRLIMRDLLPDVGEISLADENIVEIKNKNIPKLRQKMGVVFQDFKLLSERTARENVEVALAVIGLSQKEWKERVDHVLGLVGLKDRSEFFPSQLSGGELQRISLARALVVNPKIILADEPTGNLDWDTAQKLMDLFESINKEGKTIIMATHHQGLIERMNKRVIVLDKPSKVKKEVEKNNNDDKEEKKDEVNDEKKDEVNDEKKSKKRLKVKK